MKRLSLADHAVGPGELRVALDGDAGWKSVVGREDVLVCGSLSTLDDLPEARWPHCVVLVGPGDPQGSRRLARLQQSKTTVLQYDLGLAELFRGLTLQIRLEALNLPEGPCVGEFDRVDDIRPMVVNHQHALPVVNADAAFCGVLSRSDLSRGGRTRVVLVDHFEQPQSVPDLQHAEILEIVDHHRVGDIQTRGPVRVLCQPVGSSCTIVAGQYRQHEVPLDPPIALLLLGGIVADTLVLRGPTTTDTDRLIAAWLAEIAGVDVETFGTDVLVAGDDLIASSPSSIWDRDQKEFSIRNQNFAVAQLETASLTNLPVDRFEAFAELVQADQLRHDRLLSLMVVTDVLRGDSWMYAAEAEESCGVVQKVFASGEPIPGWYEAPGVVSRKKQIVPRLMEALAS